jgi:hypothetical protein
MNEPMNPMTHWEHQAEMVRLDNDLRHRTPEQRRQDAERRLQDLEARAAESEQEADPA